MTDTAATEEPRKLAEITGFIHDGILASTGTITLTDQQLRFTPNDTYRRLGTRAFEVPITDIVAAEVEGINRLLKVRTEQQVHVFSGSQIRIIRDRLASLIDTVTDVDALYEPDERILSVFPAQRPVSKLMSTEGTIVVTSKRLHFQPGGVGGLVWKEAGFSIDIGRIETMELAGRRGQFTIRDGQQEVVFTCSAQAELHGSIRLIQDRHTVGDSTDALDVELHKAYVHKGALAVSGFCVLTERRFSFVPTGLDRIAGSSDRVELFYEDIVELSRSSSSESRLSLVSKAQTVDITVDDVKSMMRYFAWKLSSVESAVQKELQESGKSAKEYIFEEWSDSLSVDSDSVDYLESGVYLSRRELVQQGWLMLAGKYLFWVPCGGSETGAAVMTLPLRQVHSMTDDGDYTKVDFAVRGHRYQFWAESGTEAHQAFWDVASRQQAEQAEFRLRSSPDRSDRLNRRETYRVLSSGDEAPPAIQGQMQSDEMPPQPFEGQLVDFSFGGCAFVVDHPVSTADELHLMITGPSESELVRAEVVYERKLRRMQGYRVGVRFQPTNSSQAKLLRTAWMMMQRSVAAVRSQDYWSIFEDTRDPNEDAQEASPEGTEMTSLAVDATATADNLAEETSE